MASKIYIQPWEDLKLAIGLFVRELSATNESNKLNNIEKRKIICNLDADDVLIDGDIADLFNQESELVSEIWESHDRYVIKRIKEHEDKKAVHNYKLIDVYDSDKSRLEKIRNKVNPNPW